MENREEFRKELGNLVGKLQEKHQFMSYELDTISKLTAMLYQISIFSDGNAASAAERIFGKKSDGAYELNLLGDIRNVFISKGYDAALDECANRFNLVEEQLKLELELETPTEEDKAPAYDVAKFQEIKSFFGLKTDDATLNLLVNMAHAELGETKSNYIRAKKKGEKPSNISKYYGINYNQVKKLSEQYKDV